MPYISPAKALRHRQYLTSMDTDAHQWRDLWRELSDNYLPQRYRWLMSQREYFAQRARRQYIINNTGTQSARTLAAGMMNGITSPSRPWFKLRVPGYSNEQYTDVAVWLEEVERRLMRVMAESNFYNSMAVLYLDMAVFGTGVSIIYEDFESVIRCYNPPLGEYRLAQSHRQQVNIFSRSFILKAHQFFERWPDRRYWSDRMKMVMERLNQGNGAAAGEDVEISHIIAPNHDGMVPSRFDYYECYWETRRQQSDGQQFAVLELRGFNELPGMFARWELSGSDAYGVSPAMDCLGDNIELQHLHRQKAVLLEKMHKPPVLADVQLQNTPLAMMPGGTTYVPNLNNTAGARPIFTVDPRFDQLNIDIQAIQQRIRDTFFNFLFTGVTDLPTVRSATEIEARETEKLILLGGVLERFESEALDPAIARIYSIAERAGIIPPPPVGLEVGELEIQYVSILSTAQRAVGVAPTERYLQLVGNLAAIRPDVLDIPKFDVLLTNYARDIGVRESEINTGDDLALQREKRAQEEQLAALAEAAPAAQALSGAAKNLSETEVGGGQNVIQQITGG